MPEYRIKLIVEGDDRASGMLQGVGRSLQRIGEFATGTLLAGGIERIAGAFVGGIQSGAEFGAELSAIQANANATAEEMDALKEQIIGLGLDPKLKVTTLEATDAVDMLIRNGLTLQDVLDGAAYSTVLLANATGAQFGTAADIGTDAMSTFGIQAADMASAVNGISAVVNNSKFDINDYQLALAQGGAAAQIAGASFDEFNAAVVALAPKFASGSDAGTSFKTFLQRLVPQSKEAASAMSALGLEFFNADGSMRDLAEIAGELNQVFYGQVQFSSQVGGRTAEQNAELKRLQSRYASLQRQIGDYQAGITGAGLSESARQKKLANLNAELAATQAAMEPLLSIQGELVSTTRQLSEEERIHYLNTIFGTDAMRAAAAIAGYTEEEFRGLLEQLGQTDAVKQAGIRMDNLAGDVEILGGTLEGLSLSFIDELDPSLRSIVQAVTQGLTDLTPTLLSIGSIVAQGVAAATPTAVTAIEGLVTAVEAILTGKAFVIDVEIEEPKPPIGSTSPFPGLGRPIKVGAQIAPINDLRAELAEKFVKAPLKVKVLGIFEWEVPPAFTNLMFTAAETALGSYDPTTRSFRVPINLAPDFKLPTIAELKKALRDFLDQEFVFPFLGPGGLTIPIKINIADIFWPEPTPSLATDADIGSVTWPNPIPDLPASADIGSITWPDPAPTLDASARVDAVISSLKYPDTITPLQVPADVSAINWGNPRHIYTNVGALVGGVDFQEDKFGTIYPSNASVTDVFWGNYTHTYQATAKVVIDPADLADINTLLDLMNNGGRGGQAGGQALGSRYYRGGTTWVGEFGPEIVELPPGSRIHSAARSRELAAEGGGPMVVVNAQVASDIDIEAMAYRIADVMRRRGGR